MTYTSDEWEKYVEEWVSYSLKPMYKSVQRFTGSGDRGIDVAGFADDKKLLGVWDNYQCKHFPTGIVPSEAWPEIGKILWHSFNGEFVPPRAYFFIAPRGTGTKLSQLLANTPLLKKTLLQVWDKSVSAKITETMVIKLEGDFAAYVNAFDFSVFKSVPPREIMEQHRLSPYFIGRFGGGLPARPAAATPPDDVQPSEGGYVGKLLEAYADHSKEPVPDISTIKKWKHLDEHFNRQRESFYHAESLRVFVRDKVEPGTFEGLQDEVLHGVIDTCDAAHADGFQRVVAVTTTAQSLPLDAHALGSSATLRDKRGICHQLANEDRLKWTK